MTINYIMSIMLIRSVIVYVITLIVIRLMGKRQVGEMQPFEFVITLIIADLACVPMAELSVPLTHGVVPILVLFIVHFLICFLARKSMKFRYALTGKPAIVITPKGIDYKELRSLNMTIDDLMELVRGCQYFDVDQIAYAIIETNGNVCIIPKSNTQNVIRDDLKIDAEPAAMPISLIMDGRVIKKNVELANLSEEFLNKYYKKVNVASHKQIVLFTIDNNGKIFIQPRNRGKYYTFQETNFKGGKQW